MNLLFFTFLKLKIKINFEKKTYGNNKNKLYYFEKKRNERGRLTSNIILQRIWKDYGNSLWNT